MSYALGHVKPHKPTDQTISCIVNCAMNSPSHCHCPYNDHGGLAERNDWVTLSLSFYGVTKALKAPNHASQLALLFSESQIYYARCSLNNSVMTPLLHQYRTCISRRPCLTPNCAAVSASKNHVSASGHVQALFRSSFIRVLNWLRCLHGARTRAVIVCIFRLYEMREN